MAERKIKVQTAIMLTCRECHPTVNEQDRASCTLEKFQADFEASEKTPADLDRLARQHGLDKTFYVEQNGVPHFKCPEKRGSFSGRIAIFASEDKE